MIIDAKVTAALSPAHQRARLRVEYITEAGHQLTFMLFGEDEYEMAYQCAASLCGVTDIATERMTWSERRANAEPLATNSPKRRGRRTVKERTG